MVKYYKAYYNGVLFLFKKICSFIIVAVLVLSVTVCAKAKTEAKNLIAEAGYGFEGNMGSIQSAGWTSFSGAAIGISSEGYDGSCLKASGFKYTWSSPSIDLFPIVVENGSGVYSLSMMIKVESEKDYNCALILRGTRANSVIEAKGSNFFGEIGRKTVKPDEWTRVTASFEVTNGDIDAADSWKLCLSSTPADVTNVYIDNFVFIKGSVKELPNEKTEKDSSEEQKNDGLYDPEIKENVIKACIFTGATVIIVTVLKIYGKKIFKKIKIRKDEEK
jgi:hypothetical protein